MKLCTQSLFPQWFLVAFFTVGQSIVTVCHHDITSSIHLYSCYGPMLFYPDQSLVEADTQYRSSPSILANDCSFLRKGMLTSGVLAAEVQQTCLMAILLFGEQLYGVSFNLFLMSSTCRDALVRCTRSARGRDAAKTGSTLHVLSSSFADVSSPCDDLSEPAP